MTAPDLHALTARRGNLLLQYWSPPEAGEAGAAVCRRGVELLLDSDAQVWVFGHRAGWAGALPAPAELPEALQRLESAWRPEPGPPLRHRVAPEFVVAEAAFLARHEMVVHCHALDASGVSRRHSAGFGDLLAEVPEAAVAALIETPVPAPVHLMPGVVGNAHAGLQQRTWAWIRGRAPDAPPVLSWRRSSLTVHAGAAALQRLGTVALRRASPLAQATRPTAQTPVPPTR